MAHVLSITDGTTTLDLAATTDAGYHFVSFRPRRPNRVLSRVSGYPYTDGQRTTAAALLDSEHEILVHIVGTSVDNVQDQLVTLTRMLESAQRWETTRVGSPVRLSWKRQGATNTARRVVTGVPAMPEPVDPAEGDWLDISTISNDLLVAFTVTLEPTWHTGVADILIEAEAVDSGPTTNTVTTIPANAVTGDMPAPYTVLAANTGTAVWDRVWFAELAGAPDVQDFSGTVVADTYGGEVASRTASGTASSLASVAFVMADKYRHPLRCFLRARVTSGDETKLQLQFVVRFGNVTWLETLYQTWSGFASGASSNFALIDLGQLTANSLFNRVWQTDASSEISYLVNYKTSDASSVTFETDYYEVLPIRSLVRLDGMDVRAGYRLAYEDLSKDGTFYWPRRDPQAFSTFSTGGLYHAAKRYGRLTPLLPASEPIWWFNAQSTTAHTIGTTDAELSIDHTACTALGLRGVS